MQKIFLVDYIGDSISTGEPVGHPIHVSNEYYHMLKEEFSLETVAPFNALSKVENKKTTALKYYALRDLPKKSMIIKNHIREYKNLNQVNKTCKNELLLFYNMDYLLYLWLILHSVKQRKIVVVTYVSIPETDSFLSKLIRKTLLKYASSKISLFLYLNRDFTETIEKKLFLPDYFYDKDKHKIYSKDNRKEQAVCLGTVSTNTKQILELVDIFNKNQYPLIIAGKFYSEELYEIVMNKKNSNITVKNEYISKNEYYSLLGESKYSILPYNMQNYMNKTSGVILDSIFVGATPIVPNVLLNRIGVCGIGYNDIVELEKIDFDKVDTKEYEYGNKELLQQVFDKDRCGDRMIKKLKEIIEEKEIDEDY